MVGLEVSLLEDMSMESGFATSLRYKGMGNGEIHSLLASCHLERAGELACLEVLRVGEQVLHLTWTAQSDDGCWLVKELGWGSHGVIWP